MPASAGFLPKERRTLGIAVSPQLVSIFESMGQPTV
jgi:hypothetical protein